ncbi:hypothetical protein [Actinoplanes utahensis]|uniref:Uncharacterized protein n=1 Tax=Actinoplanes utahensis TaxID=1869 RepID=A0A0A6UN38_ACTUT|nr:hypothetical protein [Actinoplanes utahensis]KHD77555.1 hypothetical protein MB27_10705 [Actinoplanes utahensis]GIF32728.1 hypothetical protein Aut01nite_57140 [Actinoplanes utahensis]
MSEHPTTAEQVHALRTEMDARIRAQREAPLPGWLAGRTARRIVAVVPPTAVLTCGLLTATRPDDTIGTVLLAVTAVLAVGALLLLRKAVRLLDSVPDRLLGEREISERNAAHRRAHGLTIGLFTLLTLVAIADGVMGRSGGTPLIPGDNWIQVLVTATLVAGMIPAAVMAWGRTERSETS